MLTKSLLRLKKNTLVAAMPAIVPIVQAPLGCCDGPRLAAAVSRAGGLGTLSVHNPDPASLQRELQQVRKVTPRPILLAFTAQWEPDRLLDRAIDQGFSFFHVFWWNGPRLAPRIRRANGEVFWQVGTLAEARDAMEIGATVLVAQGTEAGGQVRSPHPVLELVRQLRAEFGPDIPIVAGGGVADASDARRVLDNGANAVLFGTRFLLSKESNASPRAKAKLLRSKEADLQLDARLIGDWPCSPRRRLRTPTDEDNPALYAGLGIGRIHSLRSAADLVRSLAP